MRFMLLFYPDARAERGEMPGPKLVEQVMRYNEALARAGVLLAVDGLLPTASGARVRFPGGTPHVTEGPFGEQNVIGGYWLLQVRSKAEAIEWAKRVPAEGANLVELRQVFEPCDFAGEAQIAFENETVRRAPERTRT